MEQNMAAHVQSLPVFQDDIGFWLSLMGEMAHPIAVVHKGCVVYHNTGTAPFAELPADSPFHGVLSRLKGGQAIPPSFEISSPDGTGYATARDFLYKGQEFQILCAHKKAEAAHSSWVSEIRHSCETRMREISHRTKNSISTIMSLLTLQESSISSEDGKAALRKSRDRAHAIMRIYETLSLSGKMDSIRIDVILRQIAEELVRTYCAAGMGVELKLNLDEAQVAVATAIPVTLIVNELVTNALKHAFSRQNGERLEISLTNTEHQLLLTVKDNGKGLPAEFDIRKTDSLGFTIIQALASQAGAVLSFEKGPGTHINLAFSANNA
jgi:two-component sensor histidine kinase